MEWLVPPGEEYRGLSRQKWCSVAMAAVLLVAALDVATASAPSIEQSGSRDTRQLRLVKFGVDNILDLRFEPLRGKRIALVCNSASRTRLLHETAEVFGNTTTIIVRTILVPEYSYWCNRPVSTIQQESIAGVRVQALIGVQRRPTKAMLEGCDATVVDLQDVGLRSQTTLATLYWVLDACAEYGIPVYVLDRPNPLGGEVFDGAIPDPTAPRTAFTVVPVPYIHGMTIGELALMINNEGWLSNDSTTNTPRRCELHIIKMRRWRRHLDWENIGTEWLPTSPNVPTIAAIRGMAITGLLGELGTVSVGIGTDSPFECIGAPELPDSLIAALLDVFRRYRISAYRYTFTPNKGVFQNAVCQGVRFTTTPGQALSYYSIAMALLETLVGKYPPARESLARDEVRSRLFRITGDRVFLAWNGSLSSNTDFRSTAQHFAELRSRYLLYP
ncbi:MAG: DUF1343 domain-containing protein [Chlorobi bacterium]|nr:DUF1343 domain-containing protein [Chlorobiota bacterium]